MLLQKLVYWHAIQSNDVGLKSEKQKNIWKNRVSNEIKLAMQVQKKLMPQRDMGNYPVFGLNIPAREISGDFYDFYPLDDRIYFNLSDVSGKG